MDTLILKDLLRFLEEDLPAGDITSEALVKGMECRAAIVAKREGVIAGVEEAEAIFRHAGVRTKPLLKDGSIVAKGARILEVEGPADAILGLERTVLNLMGRMSGIATMTRAMVERVTRVNPRCRIASTRKTCPGLRYFDKKAVMLGGGLPHRFSLSDMILIKDNHLALVPLEEAIRRVRRLSLYRIVEVEVTTPEEATRAAEAGADILMLDNMPPMEVKRTLEALQSRGMRDKVTIEVSGGVSEENVQEYAGLDIDVISAGALTHSVRNLDLSLEVEGRL